MSNIIHLPRAPALRGSVRELRFYVRMGRNDHREVPDLIATGERSAIGSVIDAANGSAP